MRTINPPSIDSIEFLHKAGKRLHETVKDKDGNDVENIRKTVYDDNKAALEAAYRNYDAKTTPIALEKLIPLWPNPKKMNGPVWQKRKGVYDLYDRERKFLSDLWESISCGANRKLIICPLCDERPVEDLDHYVPREVMPEYSVHVKNIIPTCHRCNNLKLNDWLDDKGERKIFNAYYDSLPTESAIVVDIEEDESSSLPRIVVKENPSIDMSVEANRRAVYTVGKLRLIFEVLQGSADDFFKDKCTFLKNQYRNNKKMLKGHTDKQVWESVKESITDTINDGGKDLHILIYKEICSSLVFEKWIMQF